MQRIMVPAVPQDLFRRADRATAHRARGAVGRARQRNHDSYRRSHVPLDTTVKTEIIGQHATSEGDTGSPEAQVALLTRRISDLTEPLKVPRQHNTIQAGINAPRPGPGATHGTAGR